MLEFVFNKVASLMFTEKYLCWGLFKKVAGLHGRPGTLLKRDRDSKTGVFLWLMRNFKNIYFKRYLQTAASEDLSSAVIAIFRRYFGSSSLSLFYKIVALKTSAKLLGKHICRRRSFSLKFYHKLKTASSIFFNKFC